MALSAGAWSTDHELDQLPHDEIEFVQAEVKGEDDGRHTWGSLVQRNLGHEQLERTLERPQLTGIAISGTIGIGIWSNTGELISIAGSAGCVIAYASSAFLVTAVMRSLAELVSVRPFSGALMDFPATFVDPALGFAVGVTYWLAQCFSMASLTSAAVRTAGNYYRENDPLSTGGKAGITAALLIITLLSNVCGIKLYGNLERGFKIFKMVLALLLFILMIAVNLGAGGPKLGSDSYTKYSITPGFRPGGYSRTGQEVLEIPDGPGQFLAIWTSITLAVFSCMGGDLVVVAAGEAKFPRRDLAPATRYMYLVPLITYVLLSFVVGFNINYLDDELLHPWSRLDKNLSHSPFYIVLKRTSFAGLAATINACFLLSAYTAANTGLYVSSRTLFSLAQKYGSPYFKTRLGIGKTNAGSTPMVAILCCSALGCISFLCLADHTYDVAITALGAFFVGGVACVYASECVAFIRFKKGLDRLQLHDRLSRNDLPYTQLNYRGHWQPLCAYVGVVGCTLLVLFSGWVPAYILASRGALNSYDDLLGNGALIAQLLGAYAGPVLFITLFLTYKYVYRTSLVPLRTLDEEVYLPPEFSWDKSERVELHSFKDFAKEIWSFTK